jgi:hypothetical protein
MTTPSYPRRPPFFSHRFCRLMGKVCLANEIGSEACWMLSVIAMTEDAKSYRDAVSYFNEQLFPILGLGSVSSLVRVREKCVSAGWLVHLPGAKGKAARYWVTIPPRFADMDDAPTDENPDDYRTIPAAGDKESGGKAVGKRRTTGEEAADNRRGSGEEATNNLPVPVPSPFPVPNQNPPTPLQGEESDEDSLFQAIAEACERDPVAAKGSLKGPFKALRSANPPFTAEEVREFTRDLWIHCDKAKKSGRTVPYPNELKNNIVKVRVAARKRAKRDAARIAQSQTNRMLGEPPKPLAEELALMTTESLLVDLENLRRQRVLKSRQAAIEDELKRREGGES